MPEVELGWTPPWTVGRLADVVGMSQARWLMMSCHSIKGAEAAKIGLVNEAVPEDQLLRRVERLADRLAAIPALGLANTKALLNRMSPLRESRWDVAASEAFRECYATPEAQSRIKAFAARKKK